MMTCLFGAWLLAAATGKASTAFPLHSARHNQPYCEQVDEAILGP
jgi:hypothetical protein